MAGALDEAALVAAGKYFLAQADRQHRAIEIRQKRFIQRPTSAIGGGGRGRIGLR
jgi:hypothetical protein